MLRPVVFQIKSNVLARDSLLGCSCRRSLEKHAPGQPEQLLVHLVVHFAAVPAPRSHGHGSGETSVRRVEGT